MNRFWYDRFNCSKCAVCIIGHCTGADKSNRKKINVQNQSQINMEDSYED